MQSIATIQKTATLKATYYTTSYGTLMCNGDELTVTFGNDGYCGVTSLEAGLEIIQWDKSAETKHESITWATN